MKNKLQTYVVVLLVFSFKTVIAQSLLDQEYFQQTIPTERVESTFKTLRIGLGHSIETRKKGVLEISSYTRYWNVPEIEGEEVERNNFVSDRASARFGFDYALTDDLSAGLGWSSTGVFDGYLKYRLLYQENGVSASPVSITLLGSATHRSKKIYSVLLSGGSIYDPVAELATVNQTETFLDKTSYIGQVLLARKINKQFSLQMSPTVIYRGSTNFIEDDELQLALGFGGRYALGRHVSIESEYFYVPEEYKLNSIRTFGAFSLGVNWEVSKVLIQLFLSNTGNYTEDIFITETPVNFNTKNGNLFFGFNFSYVLHLKKNK